MMHILEKLADSTMGGDSNSNQLIGALFTSLRDLDLTPSPVRIESPNPISLSGARWDIKTVQSGWRVIYYRI